MLLVKEREIPYKDNNSSQPKFPPEKKSHRRITIHAESPWELWPPPKCCWDHSSSPSPQRMADHDLRREAMKKQRSSQTREFLHTDHEMGSDGNYVRELGVEEIIISESGVADDNEDLARVLQDLSNICLACTAKAA